MASEKSVTRLADSQMKRFGQVLSEAFYNEPNFTYILPNATVRRAALPWFFGVFVARIGLHYGEVYTTETTDGGAIWQSPGSKVTFAGALQAGMLAMPFKFGWGGLRRSMNLGGYLDQVRWQSVPGRHWYLMALGVDPSKQGKGIGGALIQPVLSRADADGLPCYLETFKDRNLRFYEKHGFTVSLSDQIPEGGPNFWTMVREPRK
jgi:GNAT superfamily N-acetyltransferase